MKKWLVISGPFLLWMALSPDAVFGQGSSTVEAGAGGSGAYNYRFLDPLPQEGRGHAGGEAAEEEEKAEVLPKESPEEREARENIRNVLRLVDGDTVEVGKDIQVRLVGVSFPQFENYQGNRQYEAFARRVKEWIDEFMSDPAKALSKYEAIGSHARAESKEGQGFSFFYLYLPDVLLEEIRRQELEKYDAWVKEHRSRPAGETDAQKSQRAILDLGRKEDREGAASRGGADPLKEVKEYVVSEAKYYFPDGSLKREEVYRDGKLMIRRDFNRDGEVSRETFYDPQAADYTPEKKK